MRKFIVNCRLTIKGLTSATDATGYVEISTDSLDSDEATADHIRHLLRDKYPQEYFDDIQISSVFEPLNVDTDIETESEDILEREELAENDLLVEDDLVTTA